MAGNGDQSATPYTRMYFFLVLDDIGSFVCVLAF